MTRGLPRGTKLHLAENAAVEFARYSGTRPDQITATALQPQRRDLRVPHRR